MRLYTDDMTLAEFEALCDEQDRFYAAQTAAQTAAPATRSARPGKVHRAVYQGGSTSALCASSKFDEHRRALTTTADAAQVTCRACLRYMR